MPILDWTKKLHHIYLSPTLMTFQTSSSSNKATQPPFNNQANCPSNAASNTGTGAPSDAEILQEAKMLREHKGRLESRMKILEDHNSQLESQLGKLKMMLHDVSSR